MTGESRPLMSEMRAPETSASQTTQNEAAIFQRLHPVSYLRRFLSENLRPDGREPAEFRSASLNTGSISTAHGSALVQLGQTSVVCGVRIEVAAPDVLRPKHGFVVPNLELSPLCSSRFRPGPPGDEAQTLNDRVHKILQAADLVPLRSLCIEPGKAVFVIYLDLVCINYDGNVIDASVLAANAALRDTRLPNARWDEEEQVAVEDASEPEKPLRLQSPVLSSSFGVFDGTTLLADPDSFEESLCGGRVTLALDESGQIRHTWLAGNVKDGPAVLKRCLAMSRERWKTFRGLLDP